MNILENYETITYERGDTDKYTNERYDNKTKVTYKNGYIHSLNDKPAMIVFKNVNYWEKQVILEKIWYRDGVIHRDFHKPAKMLHSQSIFGVLKILYNNGRRYIVDNNGNIIYV